MVGKEIISMAAEFAARARIGRYLSVHRNHWRDYAMTAPTAFISYSWSSPDHEKWVISLAEQLQHNGVQVTLDKWDLKEGHDAIAFMERMVTDPAIKKVIVVLDKAYAEKADGRAGGVGKETQIISAGIYEKADQDKFVGVIAELNADGKPYLPTFYKSRIHIDLSSDDSYGKNFDQLLRWLFNKPLHVRPPLGKPPAFLDDTTPISLSTGMRSRRALDAIRSSSAASQGLLDEYLEDLTAGLEKFRIDKDAVKNESEFDEAVLENVSLFVPYRNEYVEVISACAKLNSISNLHELLHRFFERVAVYGFRPQSVSHYHTYDWDNFKFIAQELFLYTIALLLKYEKFSTAKYLVDEPYYLGGIRDDYNESTHSFEVFSWDYPSLQIRNKRLSLNRMSLFADLMKERSSSGSVSFKDITQADFILFMRGSVIAAKQQVRQLWWPHTMYLREYRSGPFEIFVRARSVSKFNAVKELFGVSDKADLDTVLSLFENRPRPTLHVPWDEWGREFPRQLMDFANLATR